MIDDEEKIGSDPFGGIDFNDPLVAPKEEKAIERKDPIMKVTPQKSFDNNSSEVVKSIPNITLSTKNNIDKKIDDIKSDKAKVDSDDLFSEIELKDINELKKNIEKREKKINFFDKVSQKLLKIKNRINSLLRYRKNNNYEITKTKSELKIKNQDIGINNLIDQKNNNEQNNESNKLVTYFMISMFTVIIAIIISFVPMKFVSKSCIEQMSKLGFTNVSTANTGQFSLWKMSYHLNDIKAEMKISEKSKILITIANLSINLLTNSVDIQNGNIIIENDMSEIDIESYRKKISESKKNNYILNISKVILYFADKANSIDKKSSIEVLNKSSYISYFFIDNLLVKNNNDRFYSKGSLRYDQEKIDFRYQLYKHGVDFILSSPSFNIIVNGEDVYNAPAREFKSIKKQRMSYIVDIRNDLLNKLIAQNQSYDQNYSRVIGSVFRNEKNSIEHLISFFNKIDVNIKEDDGEPEILILSSKKEIDFSAIKFYDIIKKFEHQADIGSALLRKALMNFLTKNNYKIKSKINDIIFSDIAIDNFSFEYQMKSQKSIWYNLSGDVKKYNMNLSLASMASIFKSNIEPEDLEGNFYIPIKIKWSSGSDYSNFIKYFLNSTEDDNTKVKQDSAVSGMLLLLLKKKENLLNFEVNFQGGGFFNLLQKKLDSYSKVSMISNQEKIPNDVIKYQSFNDNFDNQILGYVFKDILKNKVKKGEDQLVLKDIIDSIGDTGNDVSLSFNADNFNLPNGNKISFGLDLDKQKQGLMVSNFSTKSDSNQFNNGEFSLLNGKSGSYYISAKIDQAEMINFDDFRSILSLFFNKKIDEQYNIPSFMFFNGMIDINSKYCFLGKKTFSGCKIQSLVDNGSIVINSIYLKSLDDLINITGLIDLNSKPIIKLNVANYNKLDFIGKIFKTNNLFDGIFSYKGSLSCSGFSVKEIIESIEGYLESTILNLRIKNFNILNLSKDLIYNKNKYQDVDVDDLIKNDLLISKFSGYINFDNGLMKSDGLSVKQTGLSGIFDFSVDLKSKKLNSFNSKFIILGRDPRSRGSSFIEIPISIVARSSLQDDSLDYAINLEKIHDYIRQMSLIYGSK